jgi:hypothetical protein
MPAVIFTAIEYNLLTKASVRLLKSRATLPAKHWNKPQNKIVKDFATKFAFIKPEDDLTDETRILSRNEARLIQEFSNLGVIAIKKDILPAYDKRILEEPDKKEFYTTYLVKAEQLLVAYEAILKKVEAIL